MYLTKRQREVLDYIERFIAERGYSPSLEEIGEGVGLTSLATIHKHLQNLQQKGVIRRAWNRGRSIEITQSSSGDAMFNSRMLELPIFGKVAAGLPIAAIDDPEPETLCVPQEFVKTAETFVLKVEGDSMIDEQIRDGDYIIVEPRQTALNGETVVALVDQSEATVKKYYREPGNMIRLQPANERLAPMYFPSARVLIRGVVVGLMRRYN
jgi:repressor LexA